VSDEWPAATLTELIKAISITSPGSEPIFLRKKTYAATTRIRGRPTLHLREDRVLRLGEINYLQGQLHGAGVPDVAAARVGTFSAPGD